MRWAGWLAFMGWRGRLYWILTDRTGWYPPARLRKWGAAQWIKAYMAWKAARYEPESWPR